ncbi:DUF5655 domain-containing protein [Streptodolium elevatio]|uniref:DUF5655 domain-containing protein n=1 Tax=Streptodolium elevatio TaxID=3157996 RepID=A0ABV3DF14_9ACTN
MARPRTWQEMRDSTIDLLVRRTGEGLDVWNRRVRDSGVRDEAALRAWLDERDLGGYPQSLLVWERFGYPEFLTASADNLLAGQYDDRPALRPVLDALLVVGTSIADTAVQVRKTYVTLVSPKRQYALIRATTRDRLDLGLRLPGAALRKPLLPARGLGNDTINVRVPLHAVEDVDQDVEELLERAYQANV